MPLFGKKEDKEKKKAAKPDISKSKEELNRSFLGSLNGTSQFSAQATQSVQTSYKETRSYSVTGAIAGDVKQFEPLRRSLIQNFDFPSTSSSIRSSVRSLPEAKFPPVTRSSFVTTDAKPIYGYQPSYVRTNTNQYVPVFSNNNHHAPTASASYPSLLSPINQSAVAPNSQHPLEQVVNGASGAKKLAVKVVKTGKRYDTEAKPVVPTYKTSSKKRGRALIINNMKFIQDKHYRHGAELDETNITELFKQMGFEVTKKKDVKSKDIGTIAKKFANTSAWKSVDISVVVVMSHGDNIDGSTQILCSDERVIPTDDIIDIFTAEKCKDLDNKPKIFIFQCCRGKGSDEAPIATDASPFRRPRNYADLLIAHATVPGYASHRDPELGTWYIQTLCEVFAKNAHHLDVESMLKIVDDRLSQYRNKRRQTSSYESRGFKRCYFHP